MMAVAWYGSFVSLNSARLQSQQSGDGKNKSCLSANATGWLTESHHVLGGLNDGDIDLWVGDRRRFEAAIRYAPRPPRGSDLRLKGRRHRQSLASYWFVGTSISAGPRVNYNRGLVVIFSGRFIAMVIAFEQRCSLIPIALAPIVPSGLFCGPYNLGREEQHVRIIVFVTTMNYKPFDAERARAK
jgi:hypothetical protein